MKIKKIIMLLLILGTAAMYAREPEEGNKKRKSSMKALAEGCAAATSSADLSINNVRARILGSGDMWWDLNDAKYEVPKGSNKHSMFAGALWLGGYDEADQLRLAAMTYRQDGVDYWPGPLSNDNTASITAETCERYNRHWTIYREDVDVHAAWVICKADPDCNDAERFPGYEGNVPQVIQEWPGNGIDGELPNKLAPYYETDQGTPGLYEWRHDYPGYDIDGSENCQEKEVDLLYGDETIWWVYNDKGNIHTETQASALGFEIRAQAFAFTSNDEVNNMTFNNYRIINKSTFRLTDTYFGTWFDADLGDSEDDIIGCDIAKGLGYVYNADNYDDPPLGYGYNPPAVGFDFFQGPFADYFDGIDNDRDGCVDAVRRGDTCISEDPAAGINERIIMSGFMYYNRAQTGPPNPNIQDPQNAPDFYNYLNSRWKDGKNLIIESPSGRGATGNGDGYVASNAGTPTKFAYPGMSYDTTGAYEPFAPVDWWESPTNDADKRGLHSAGPFSLAPGALNFITTGVVWARNFNSNDLFASVNDVILADNKAQQLFDNCFDVLDGPDSPELEIVELDRELVLLLKNAFTDKTIGYEEIDPAIAAPSDLDWTAAQIDSAEKAGYYSYRFEGFQIFQVDGPNISIEDIYDQSQSRLIFQCDLKNDVEQLVNYTVDPSIASGALVPQDMTIEANNEGIQLSFRVTEDAFAQGNSRLVNNREYYFYVIAYSQNDYITTNPRNLGQPSQKMPYLAGRKIGNDQKPYLGIPNKRNSIIVNSEFGQGLPVTRFAGAGNSGNFVRITDESRARIAAEHKIDEIDYLAGAGPVDVRIIDPMEVVGGDYLIEFNGVRDSSTWKIYNRETMEPIDSTSREFGLSYLGEHIIDELGIAVALRNPEPPGYDDADIRNNGLIGGEVEFTDPRQQWLTGVPDDDLERPTNWILAGNTYAADGIAAAYSDRSGQDAISPDPFGVFETLLNGTWAPASLISDVVLDASIDVLGFGVRPEAQNYFGHAFAPAPLAELPNVDIVITKDHTKWTRVPVFELADEPVNAEGNTEKFKLRSDFSLVKNSDGTLSTDPDSTRGWSYFPGYAVNVETGRRLHMAFGENSWLKSENGGDMLWNPSSSLFRKLGSYGLGGMHMIYVFADSVTMVNISRKPTTIDLTYEANDDSIRSHPLIDYFDAMNGVSIPGMPNVEPVKQIFSAITWAGFPLAAAEEYEFTSYSGIPTDAVVKLRVDRPYQKTDSIDPNNGYPMYGFNTNDYISHEMDLETRKSALDLVKVVPNPYYGSSEYEDTQLDNIVKITNLPERCKISILMTNGTLIRTINKDNALTFVEWDMRNDFNVPIASGIYLIHIDAGEAGETVLKWLGAMRPVDLNAF